MTFLICIVNFFAVFIIFVLSADGKSTGNYYSKYNEYIDPKCECDLDQFGKPNGWKSTDICLDLVIILDTSEAMSEAELSRACLLIDSLTSTLTTDTNSNFLTRVGLITASGKVLFNLNLTRNYKVERIVKMEKGLRKINDELVFNASFAMLAEGSKINPDRANTRQVIYYLSNSGPNNVKTLRNFKEWNGMLLIDEANTDDLSESGISVKSEFRYSSMKALQLLCKVNCFFLKNC